MRAPLTLARTAIGLWLALTLAACGATTPAITSSKPSLAPSTAIDGVFVTDAWVRPPIGPDRPAAGYLTIHNTLGQDDALIGVSSPVAAAVEIHETVADDSGMMGMRPVARIAVPVGATVSFEPGGYHLMLLGVTGMPAVGETVELSLSFEVAGDVAVEAEVRAD